MALTDINFSEGEGQDFLVELPVGVYNGSFTDVLIETNGSQTLVMEIPEAAGNGGGDIFIMSE